jgi:hypothetical protein
MASRIVANAYSLMAPDTETDRRSAREQPLIISMVEAPVEAVNAAQEASKEMARMRSESIFRQSRR